MYYTNIFKLLFLLLLLTTGGLSAQETGPYYLSWEREIYFGSTAIAAAATGFALHNSVAPVQLGDIKLPRISGPDEWAPTVLSLAPSDVSDVFLFSSIALPVAFLAGTRTRHDYFPIGVLYVEAMLLNAGITDIVKTISLRPRPYNFNPELLATTVLERNDRSSFFSGHTSVAATASFFCARVFADYYPNSKYKPLVWTAATALPALVGYLRVRAGKHYPSDVLVGYLVGGAIGYVLPTLHKRPLVERKLRGSVGIGGAVLNYRF